MAKSAWAKIQPQLLARCNKVSWLDGPNFPKKSRGENTTKKNYLKFHHLVNPTVDGSEIRRLPVDMENLP